MIIRLNSDEFFNIVSQSKTLTFMYKILTKIWEIEQKI